MAFRALGRLLIGLGTLMLLFLLYELIGTNFVNGREQKALAVRLEQRWKGKVSQSAASPEPGDPVALIKIPRIGVDAVVVEGAGVADLKKGPGHYPGTAMPGQPGNMVISGHRTIYGAPFYRLDELRPGDEIQVYNGSGPFRYVVTETRVVLPNEIGVVASPNEARLTLVTSHPRFSARKRLMVVAQLVMVPSGASGGAP